MLFEEILKSIVMFLPAYLANGAPVVFDKFNLLPGLKKPIDGGRKIGKDYVFGETKTWRGLVAGVLVGALTGVIVTHVTCSFKNCEFTLVEALIYGPGVGAILGFGIIMGDLIKSFFKRRLHIKSTAPFFPFDQMDYLGALLLLCLFFPLHSINFWIILIISPLFPILANITAYFLGWKKVWW